MAGVCSDMMPHNPLGPICTAANIHFAAAIPNFAWLEERLYPRRGATPGDDINSLLSFTGDADADAGNRALAENRIDPLVPPTPYTHAPASASVLACVVLACASVLTLIAGCRADHMHCCTIAHDDCLTLCT